ncbi:hypothetical protein ILYODFUR_021955 [Ilyodon furcidens]|uniref:Uncharacterized protein n=1 Tax=Ilyodon furcidens TaxID=33524 RepID=A0ABV0UJI7_9TELE
MFPCRITQLFTTPNNKIFRLQHACKASRRKLMLLKKGAEIWSSKLSVIPAAHVATALPAGATTSVLFSAWPSAMSPERPREEPSKVTEPTSHCAAGPPVQEQPLSSPWSP